MLPQPHPSPLSHFVSYFVPLSERMFDYQSTAEMEERQAEAKVWSVLVAQIWTGLVGYCYGTPDLPSALSAEFAQLLTQLLYSQPELRPAVLKAVKALVDSNVALASEDPEKILKLPAGARAAPITAERASQNVAFLRTQAESWLAVLFNIFGSVDRDARGPVGDVISVWASITPETVSCVNIKALYHTQRFVQEIAKAFQNVVALLKQNLAKPRSAGPDSQGSVAATTQDLLLLLLPHLSPVDSASLFELCLSTDVLGSSDNGVQKRGYKLLTRLVESERVPVDDAGALLARLDEGAEGLAAAAKKDRFTLLSLIVPRIPPSALHLIPSIIPEAVLGTKEPSEKARSAAFDLIVAMGRKMAEGGVVKRAMMDGMDEDDNEDSGEGVCFRCLVSLNLYLTIL
jgi:ribosomal RNA-processing protein 12